ncbi:calcium-binding protein, partial [Roseibaca sp. Y0-43]|uniref:calcium-binding protein n=1 Tax=Roseibaca sp. Y0-43 TaxID=2816854 RepID=UPI001DD592B9|nr:hypothetical protein [Roseibaca sp. Y0-43]
MAINIEASLVDGDTIVETDPADASFFNLFEATTAGPQIAPGGEVPIVNPLTGETLPSFIDGIVIGSELNGLKGSGTALASAFFLENASDIDLSDEVTLLIFTFEQPDGSQLVVRATITNGDGPTLQEFLDGYTLEELLASADTLNGAPYSYGPDNGGDNESTDGPDELVGDETDNFIQGLGGADVIEGLGGNDVLVGNAGSDTIWGGLG